MAPNQSEDPQSKSQNARIFFCEQNVSNGEKNKEDSQNAASHNGRNFLAHLNSFNDHLSSLSSWMSSSLETLFESHGKWVSEHPLKVIFTCFFITALCSIGLLRFHTEIRPYKLWLAQDSNFIKGLEWQQENFPLSYRQNKIVWESHNILTADAIKSMWRMHQQVNSIKDPVFGKMWKDICMKVPSLARSRKRGRRAALDRSMLFERQFYCSTVQFLKKKCYERSLLEIWGLNPQVIMNLTDTQVLKDINAATTSKVFGFDTAFESYLGGVERDGAGNIVSAKSAIHTWTTFVNETLVEQGNGTFDPGTGMEVDLINLSFESAWVETALNQSVVSEGVRTYANSASSFGIISEDNINGDVFWVSLGFSLMFVFVTIAIGKRNLVEQRPLLAAAGILSISQAVIISYGLCSALGVFYCPVNSILPVLMVGLGVDDMFVIMASWEALGQKDLSLQSRLALTMRHAGVSITVTSLTDVVAFAVGSSTNLPALASFCTYAAVGVMTVYLLQITFFISFIIYDEKRISARKNALVPCITHRDWTPGKWSQIDIIHTFFKKLYIPSLLSSRGKMLVMLCGTALVGICTYGTANLHRQFDPMWFLPPQSYLAQWHEAHNTYFPSNINTCFIFFSPVMSPDEFLRVDQLMYTFDQLPFVEKTSSVVTDFVSYVEQHPEYNNVTLDNETFQSVLSLFLNSKSGASHRSSFHFDGELACNESAPLLRTLRVPIQLSQLHEAQDQVQALSAIQEVLSNFSFPGYLNSWSEAYVVWETNEIVASELQSNLIIVTSVIFMVTLVLLASVGVAALVLLCVACTILCIAGLMWFWGLTIDTVSCIAIVLSVGLSIDYAVHIAHAYLVNARKSLSIEERVQTALLDVGPAVLLGGLSTLITFLLMAPSTSHVFNTFYKIFVGSATFGLFWGLAALPVLLVVISGFWGRSSCTYDLPQNELQGQVNSNYTKSES